MPALATTTSTGPSAASISVNARSIDAASVTSARTVSEPSGPSPERAVTATRWPWATNSLGDRVPDAAVAAGHEDGAARRHVGLRSVRASGRVARFSIEARRSGHPHGSDGRRLEGEERRATTATTMKQQSITTLPPSPEAERRSRMIKYTITMSIRVLCIFAMLFVARLVARGVRGRRRSSSPTSRSCSRTSASPTRRQPTCSGPAAIVPSRPPIPAASSRSSASAERIRRRIRPDATAPTTSAVPRDRRHRRGRRRTASARAPSAVSRDLAHRLAQSAHPHRRPRQDLARVRRARRVPARVPRGAIVPGRASRRSRRTRRCRMPRREPPRERVAFRALTRGGPGYLALTVIFAIACCALGTWQLNRRAEALAEVARIDANYDADPVPVAEALPDPDGVRRRPAVAGRSRSRASTSPTRRSSCATARSRAARASR